MKGQKGGRGKTGQTQSPHVGAAGHCPTLRWLPGTRVHIGPALEGGNKDPSVIHSLDAELSAQRESCPHEDTAES